MSTSTGIHIVGNLTNCDSDLLFGLDMEKTKNKISGIIKRNGIAELGNYYHQFENNSFTGVISLAESHISILGQNYPSLP